MSEQGVSLATHRSETQRAMDTNQLSSIVGLLAALSVASERLVEIVKGLVPALNQQSPNPKIEGWRRAALHILAALAGIVTAFVAGQAFPDTIHVPSGILGKIILGLLASGGSGFWNSILDYVNNAKDVKRLQIDQTRAVTQPAA
jgi:hypothetical protein